MIELLGEHAEILSNASDVCVDRKINGGNSLSFKLPIAEPVTVSSRIRCDKEVYIVTNVSCDGGGRVQSVSCIHEFLHTAQHLHIPSFASTEEADYIGVDVWDVLEGLDGKLTEISGDYGYKMLTAAECKELGYEPVSGKIDYESEDKVTMWSVIENVISFLGRGEVLYSSDIDGECRWGLVERIGRDTAAILSPMINMRDVSVEYDITDMITMLWPYGDNDMDITSAPQNTDGLPYIVSPNAEVYGRICGSKSYSISDATEAGPEKLFKRAVWDFDFANPDRIDVPSVNITGKFINSGENDTPGLGDTVSIADNGMMLRERIISVKEYPLSGEPPEISVGRVKRDMFFYLSQIGALTQRYKDISAQNGKIYGSKVTGNVKGNALTSDESERLVNTAGQIVIDGNGIRILSADGTFFYVNKNRLEISDVITVADGTAEMNLDKLNLNGLAFTTDSEGNLYFNGKKVQIKEEENETEA